MKLLRRFSYIVLFMSLISCGGGSLSDGTDGGNNGGATDPIVISLALSNQNVTGQAPVTVSATVTQSNKVVADTVVTFTSTYGAFSPSSGTALTDANGVATITLTAGSIRGAGTVTAKLASGESSDISFTTQGDDIGVVGDINIDVTLIDNQGNATDTITSSKSGRVVATVNGISAPLIVTFSTTVGDIPISTAITDANNQATVDILAGSSLGAGTVTASINSGETGQVLLVVGSSTVTMGSGTPFVKGVADISLNTISAGGTTVVAVSIVDDQGALFNEPVEVNFSSRCTSSNPATASLSTPVTTSNGVATSTYLAKGCVGDDQISVTANAGGINLSATGTVNVLAADVGSIEFISAAPENIGILGTGALGGSESSTVKFKVLDTNSNPVNNQIVNFSLNTNVGGIQLIPTSATTNSEGIVQTVVNSGTVATTVRVQAAIADSSPQIASQSSLLVISTGVPDQDSFSLSASTLNPEGWDIDGTEVEITARMADAFNNPVPDGTAVSFTTEGGSIDASCVTTNGVCTVIWRSQLPRPDGHVLGDVNHALHAPESANTMGQIYGGRVTILATAIGEESFPDLNGNGRFDASEMVGFLGNNISGLPYDLKEAFVDFNEDGLFNPSEAGGEAGGDLEVPGSGDFNSNSTFDVNDKKYNGVLCSIPAHDGCSSIQKSLNVRRSLVLVMSGSSAHLCIDKTPDNVGSQQILIPVENNDAVATSRKFGLCNSDHQIQDHDNDPLTANVDSINGGNDASVYIKGENSSSASVIISDLHNQPMPAGTKVTFTATAGSVVGPSTFTWPNDNHNGGAVFGVTIKGEKEPKNGSLIIEVETPGGLSTVFSTIDIFIQ